MTEVTKLELPAHLATRELRRNWIMGLEDAIQNDCPEEAQVDCGDNLVHSFADGMYVREIFIPAGVMLTGKIHKHTHPNFLMEGKVSMITEDGGAILMEAPQSIISPAGCKRALYTVTPTWWITVHLNPNGHTKFTQKFEDEIIAKTYKDLPLKPKKQFWRRRNV
jgi:hypothetical protein